MFKSSLTGLVGSAVSAQQLQGARKHRQLCRLFADLMCAHMNEFLSTGLTWILRYILRILKPSANVAVLTQIGPPHLPDNWMTPHKQHGDVL